MGIKPIHNRENKGELLHENFWYTGVCDPGDRRGNNRMASCEQYWTYDSGKPVFDFFRWKIHGDVFGGSSAGSDYGGGPFVLEENISI